MRERKSLESHVVLRLRISLELLLRRFWLTGARQRGLDPSRAGTANPVTYDQWTVSGDYDSDRPLYRVPLNDVSGTDLYVSSATGDIALVTTRQMRLVNYVGSIPHWIYPPALRHHGQAWSALLWWLSLLATLGASIGVVIGLMRLGSPSRRAAVRAPRIRCPR